jgi:hypothetical protein
MIVMSTSCWRLLPDRMTVNTVTVRVMGLRRMRASCRIREMFRLLNKDRKWREIEIKQN